MKNLTPLVTYDEVFDYVGSLWKTDLFKASHADPNGFVHEIVSRFAWAPRIFAENSNDQLERAHFSTWWNVIARREDYSNPVISDLYYLHEITHAGTMPYVPHIGKAAFDEKMQRNELEASILSEVQVYFEMPELRAVSFDHPIYADRFLKDRALWKLWDGNKKVAVETIRTIRRDVMLSKPEHLLDLTEVWIRRFADQNAIYSITWADRYDEVESAMSDFYHAVAHDRDAALRRHIDWLTAEADKDPVDHIPFRLEAELFSPFYWANKAKYSRAMEEAK